MTVTSVAKDAATRTMTMTAEFDAPVPRVWQLYDDPRRLEWENGFATDDLEPDRTMPVMTMRMTLAPRPGGGTVMTIGTTFETVENMTWCLEMGMEEGMSSAVGQCDAVLAA